MRIIFFITLLISGSAFAEIVSIKSVEICVPETDDCISKLTIITEDSEIVVENLMGSFYLSKSNNQVFDCGGSVLRRMSHANILDEQGNKLKIEHKKHLAGCGITADEKLYWLIYEIVKNGKWLAEVIVFNNQANQVYSTTSKFESQISFKHGGDEYVIDIPGIP